LAQQMGQTLEAIPGVAFGFHYPVAMRFNELMTGAKQDVVIKIYGENLDSLARYGERMGRLVHKIRGVEDVWVEQMEGLPQLIVRLDRASLARYGLQVTDVNKQVQTAYAGLQAGELIEDEKRFDIVLRMPDELRQNPHAVQELPIHCPDGTVLPLREIAEVRTENGVNQIQRDDARRRLMVGFNARGRDVESIVTELKQRSQDQMTLAPGYFLHFGGAFEQLEHAKARLAVAVPLALGIILLLLTVAMGSVVKAGLVFMTVPLSAIGGILLLWIRDIPFSISAGVGFIVLFGVAVLNGIVLIKEFMHLQSEKASTEDDSAENTSAEDSPKSVQEILLQGTANRLRPVLMTATVASLGFLPMALSQGAGAEVQRPLATVVIGGLLLATLMTLFVLPALYQYLYRSPKFDQELSKNPHNA
ncbi:MAG: efflux RND transporter permease subunit, partial [Bacteroidota bacterium]